jgi:hypothetical protein
MEIATNPPKYYKLDSTKCIGMHTTDFHSLVMRLLSVIEVGENFEYFEEVKKYLDIPEPRKDLTEIIREYEESCSYLEERTRARFKYLGDRVDNKFHDLKGKIRRNISIVGYGSKASVESGESGQVLIAMGDGLEWSNCTISASTLSNVYTLHTHNPVGYWEVPGGAKVGSAARPNTLGVIMVGWLLGWKWKDSSEVR